MKAQKLYIISLVCLATAHGLTLRDRQIFLEPAQEDIKNTRPAWPKQYEVSYEINLPYMDILQKGGLTNHFKAWQDEANGRQKTTKDGVESVLEFTDNNTMYQIFPRIDKMACRHLEIAGGKGPTRKLLGKPELGVIMPNLLESRWRENTTATIEDGRHKGKEADAFSWTIENDMGYGDSTATYTFFVAKDGAPLRLYMWGNNLFTGGHFDAYIVDYYDFKPGAIDGDVFSVPDNCPKKISPDLSPNNFGKEHWHTKLRAMLPSRHFGDSIYDAFMHHFGKRHCSNAEYASRKQTFHKNREHVDGHNTHDNATHKLELNEFADWEHEEFLQTMLPNRGQPRPPLWAEGQTPNIHAAQLNFSMLPSTVDWRGTGADSPVKDQAMCGSCWSFGAVSSLESAYFRETGKQKLFSEQLVLDCSWDDKDMNKGCMGGFQQLAYQWLLPQGFMTLEDSYPYEGTTDFCRKDAPHDIKYSKGKYVEVQGGEQALMEALYTKGPMTVSVDASPKDFAFYKEGVYTQKECKTKIDELDHAVVVSGYGSENGQDYWIVKNTWSSNWGDKGYIKINRKTPDCGIATQPIYIDFKIEQE